MSTDTQTAVRYERDADGIVTLTLDDPNQSANTMNELYRTSMDAAVDRLYDEQDDVTGVVIASAKKTFFAGGDLKLMTQTTKDDAAAVFAQCEGIKSSLRKLEKFPKPVVAAINGAALGGGLEICLATNHRIAVDDRSVKIGLPEASLGLLPGGGGVTRTVRMFGIQSALMDILLQGPQFDPQKAQAKGLVDELVATREELVPAAKAWIKANPEAGLQPWDAPGYKMPGGTPKSPALAAFLPAFPALLRTQLKGADYPAQKAILSAAVEGAQVDFDTASRIESRYLANLVVNQGSKNMIQAFFFDLQAINSGSLRPQGIEPFKGTKVGVLGAGMMGAGIAYVCARAGMQVVLKDVAVENAEKGKAYSQTINEKAISRGKLTEEKSQELLDRITPTADPADLAGCDLVIEAVFEDPALKAKVFAEILPHVNPDALLCSNTSTLPITGLAEGIEDASKRPNFIGLHFFSPVDKMPLVEIIAGKETSDEALAKAYDVVLQIRKTPIVVNDSRGFYTSRVIGYMVNEGMAMLAEGVAPYSIERATTSAGYPAPVLQLSDELNLELMAKIAKATKEGELAAGNDYVGHPGSDVVDKMLEAGRPGRLRGAGFYEYVDGKRGSIWPGLADLFPVAEEQPPIQDVRDRMLFAEALETAKCFEEGVITSAAAANIGSIMGIGFPPNTGGAAQFMTGYEDKETGEIGLNAFLKRADGIEESSAVAEERANGEHPRRQAPAMLPLRRGFGDCLDRTPRGPYPAAAAAASAAATSRASPGATRPDVTRTNGSPSAARKGLLDATRMPAAARCRIAARSSRTGSQRLMPSGTATSTPRSPSAATSVRWRAMYCRRASATSSSDCAAVRRSSRIVWSIREVQAGPSMRRATIRSTIAEGPPSAAMRRSGPCDLAYERRWTTRSGSQVPRLTSGAIEMPEEWSSSTTHGRSPPDLRSTRTSCSARATVVETPVGLWARGWSTTATGRAARARRSESGVTPAPSSETGTTSAPSASTRSKNGG